LVLAVSLLAPLSGQAAPVPLVELSEALIRSRVASYLAQDTTRRQLAPLDALVRLDARQITYRAEGGVPRQLIWPYQPLVELNNVQRAIVELKLEEVLANVFGSYQGGLLTDADARRVQAVTRFSGGGEKTGEQPEKHPEPAESSRPHLVGPTITFVTQAVVCCYAAPSYWGNPCGSGPAVVEVVHYYQVPVFTAPPVPVHTAPAGPVHTAPSGSPGRRMPYADEEPVPAPAKEEDPSRSALSAVRRKLLLKDRGPADAPYLYLRGVQAYGHGEYQEAVDLLAVAIQLDSQDARYWYYLALGERALGDTAAARQSARRGAALELLGRADPRQTVTALERIQGEERQFLREARDVKLTRELARRLVAEPVPVVPPQPAEPRGQLEMAQLTRQP
jgi:hypothetical protein